MHVTSGPMWLRSKCIFSFLFSHLTTASRGLQILGDGGTARWKESGSLNHNDEGHPETNHTGNSVNEKQTSILLSLKCGGLFVTAASIILANLLIISVLALISLPHK